MQWVREKGQQRLHLNLGFLISYPAFFLMGYILCVPILGTSKKKPQYINGSATSLWQSKGQGQISPLKNQKGAGDKVSNFSLPSKQGNHGVQAKPQGSHSLIHTHLAAAQMDQRQGSLSSWQPTGGT